MEKKLVQNINYPNQFYYTIGNAKNYILLIHGFAEDARIFTDVVEQLSKNYTIILPNLPGSCNAQLLSDMSLEALADYCKIIMQENKIEKYIIAGHSMGGYISLIYAKKYIQNILGLALINSHVYADDDQKIIKRNQALDLIKQGKKDEVFEALINSVYTIEFIKNNPQQIKTHLEYCKQISNEAVIAYYKAMIARKDFSEWIKTTKLPIYFAIGKQDVTCDYQLLLAQTSMPSKAFINIWDNCSHTSMIEKTKCLTESLHYFIKYSFSA